jgi:hypothetical protein
MPDLIIHGTLSSVKADGTTVATAEDIANLEANVTTNVTAVATNETNIATNVSNISALETDLAALTTTVNANESNLEDKTDLNLQNITSNTTRIYVLENALNSLIARINELTGENEFTVDTPNFGPLTLGNSAPDTELD